MLLPDNRGPHRAKALRWPERVVPVYLPSYCPEWHPVERWWQALRSAVSNPVYGTLDALRERVDTELTTWNHGPEHLAALTGYPYLSDALASLDQPRETV